MRLGGDLRACGLSASPYALAKMSDQELITVWSNTTWDDGDPAMDALAAEVDRRGLDF